MSLCCPCPGCGCNNGSCGCNYTVNIESLDGSADSYQNINLVGIGVLDSAANGVVNFRGVASANAALQVSLDNTNHTVLLTVDVAAITAAIPQATTTVAGIGETATDAEALAKASIVTFLTPSNLAALGSTSTFAGLVELATNAEALAGVSTTLAITPANLTAVTSTLGTTTTFADAVARAATVPAFEGQFGGQLDTNIPYYATGAGAGNWAQIIIAGDTNNIVAGTAFNLLTGSTMTFASDGTGTYAFSSTPITYSLCPVLFSNGSVDFTTVDLNIGGGPAGANQLMTTDGAGEIAVQPITDFLSINNLDAGWTGFTNSTVRKTGDCNTITLPQLAQVVDTLIQTLGTSMLLPTP